MLRSVFLKNFVNFEEKQFLGFDSAGPFIFIGENGAGKSCVLEGIRRCLDTKYSSSVSSSFDPKQLSYFICNFEIAKDEYIISGVVTKPDTLPCESTELATPPTSYAASNTTCKADANGESKSEEGKTHVNEYKEVEKESEILEPSNCTTPGGGNKTDVNIPYGKIRLTETISDGKKRKRLAHYKFALHHHAKKSNKPLYKYLIESTESGHLIVHRARSVNESGNDSSKQDFIDTILNDKPDGGNLVEKFLLSEFDHNNIEIDIKTSENESNPVDGLMNKVVFTFPLRSTGPVQWSESDRISPQMRESNYLEAAERCEIIQCFLKDIDQKQFDRKKENQLFKALTRSDEYNFELKDGEQLILNGNKYALLKTPEGILEAKAFSILMSGKHYKTIILEEPDRGMHIQFIERMMHLIKKSQGDKRVILTTHNMAFITPWSLSDCFVFRRRYTECCIISGKALAVDTKKPQEETIPMKTLRLLTSDHLSDILFAKRVLFCEGDSDFLFLTELKQQILSDDAKQVDIFKKDIFDNLKLEKCLVELTIIKLNSKGNTQLCLNVSERMKLDAIFLLDKEPDRQFDTFKDNQKFFFWKFGDIEDMVIDMCRSKDGLKAMLNEQRVTVNPDTFQKKKKRKNKLFLRDNVEVKHIEAGTRLLLEHCEPESDLVSFIRFLYLGK